MSQTTTPIFPSLVAQMHLLRDTSITELHKQAPPFTQLERSRTQSTPDTQNDALLQLERYFELHGRVAAAQTMCEFLKEQVDSGDNLNLTRFAVRRTTEELDATQAELTHLNSLSAPPLGPNESTASGTHIHDLHQHTKRASCKGRLDILKEGLGLLENAEIALSATVGQQRAAPRCTFTSQDLTHPAIIKRLTGIQDSDYCKYLERMREEKCLGREAKLRAGSFTTSNLRAFANAYALLGRSAAAAELLSHLEKPISNACTAADQLSRARNLCEQRMAFIRVRYQGLQQANSLHDWDNPDARPNSQFDFIEFEMAKRIQGEFQVYSETSELLKAAEAELAVYANTAPVAPKLYVGYSAAEDGFWSNELGWCDLDQADRFTESERDIYRLPFSSAADAVWLEEERAKLIVIQFDHIDNYDMGRFDEEFVETRRARRDSNTGPQP